MQRCCNGVLLYTYGTSSFSLSLSLTSFTFFLFLEKPGN